MGEGWKKKKKKRKKRMEEKGDTPYFYSS